MGVEARTANLKPQELIEAQEAFLSTTAGGIVPARNSTSRPNGFCHAPRVKFVHFASVMQRMLVCVVMEMASYL